LKQTDNEPITTEFNLELYEEILYDFEWNPECTELIFELDALKELGMEFVLTASAEYHCDYSCDEVLIENIGFGVKFSGESSYFLEKTISIDCARVYYKRDDIYGSQVDCDIDFPEDVEMELEKLYDELYSFYSKITKEDLLIKEKKNHLEEKIKTKREEGDKLIKQIKELENELNILEKGALDLLYEKYKTKQK